jgi:putative FmdB family regulatory protein
VPLYEYQCDRDGRFEVIRKFSDPPLKKCPKCGGPIQRLPSAPAIQFKGTGWYVTDYAKKSGGDGSKESGAEGSKGKQADKGGKETPAAPSSSSTDSSAGSKSDTAQSGTPKKTATAGSKKDK